MLPVRFMIKTIKKREKGASKLNKRKFKKVLTILTRWNTIKTIKEKERLSDVESELAVVRRIAEGKNTAYIFDTVDARIS